MDVFSYQGVIENGIQGTSKNVTKLKITAKIHLANSKGYQFLIKVEQSKTKWYRKSFIALDLLGIRKNPLGL